MNKALRTQPLSTFASDQTRLEPFGNLQDRCDLRDMTVRGKDQIQQHAKADNSINCMEKVKSQALIKGVQLFVFAALKPIARVICYMGATEPDHVDEIECLRQGDKALSAVDTDQGCCRLGRSVCTVSRCMQGGRIW